MVSPPLERYAWPLQAPEGEPAVRLVEMDAGWRWDPQPEDARVVVGRTPMRSTKPISAALKNALQRVLFSNRVRRGVDGLRLVGSQTLPPPGGAGASGALRDWLLSGGLYRLSRDGRFPSLFNEILAAADARGAPTFHASGDGSFVARVDVMEPAILRGSKAGSPSDPARIADALELLEAAEIRRVPRPLGRGEVEGVSWMTESVLPGRAVSKVDGSLFAELVDFCAGLPVKDDPPTAWTEEIAIVTAAFPARLQSMERLSELVQPIFQDLPSAARHGDLWAGNLLVERDVLAGVVDWAAWHEAAVPGTDLLHLWASETKRGAKRELGEAWRERPWRDGEWIKATGPYWTALGVEPTTELLEAVAVAWWATWVAQSVSRYPERADNERWVRGNVDVVLESFE
jgi:Phosphotransferase enzyme family